MNAHVPVPSSRTVRVLLTLATLAAVGIVAWLFYLVLSLSAQSKHTEVELHHASVDRNSLRAQNARQDSALAEANKRLVQAGKPQVPVPSEPAVVAGPPGPAGADATMAQVDSAVNAFCSTRNDCAGPMGPQGVVGKPGAVGPKGEAGETGATGAKGDTGATGPAGSAGPKGDTGPAGPAGADSTVPGPTGPAGADGKDAFPFSFSFVVKDSPIHSTTYTCTIKDPATPVTCVAS